MGEGNLPRQEVGMLGGLLVSFVIWIIGYGITRSWIDGDLRKSSEFTIFVDWPAILGQKLQEIEEGL